MNDTMAEAKARFLSGTATLAQIARSCGIKYSSLHYRAKKENWEQERQNAALKSDLRKERILSLSDSLLDKIEQSINEIDRCVMKTKERIKTVEYDCDLKKPVLETVEEKENIEIIEGMIDKMGLKQLVSTLKDIKDIHMSIQGGSESEQEEDECGVIVLGQVDESTLESDLEQEEEF